MTPDLRVRTPSTRRGVDRPLWLAILLPVLLLAGVMALIVRFDIAERFRDPAAPPTELVSVQRVLLKPEGIVATVLNESLVGVGDDGHGDGRVPVQQRLDLDHRDVLAAADDHVLAAAGDADVAPRVDARQVAGVEPAVGVGAVELRPLQVAAEVGARAHEQPARLAGRQRAGLRRRPP